MTMGPEILAWIGADGLMDWSPGIGCAGGAKNDSGGASLRGDFDLDLHLGLVEARDDEKSCGGTDTAEHLAADGKHRVRVFGVGDVVGRPHDVGHRKAAFGERSLDGPKAVLCLARDIGRHGHCRVIVAGRAGYEGEIDVEDGAAVTGGLLERRAGGNQAAGHMVDLGAEHRVAGLRPRNAASLPSNQAAWAANFPASFGLLRGDADPVGAIMPQAPSSAPSRKSRPMRRSPSYGTGTDETHVVCAVK